MAMGSLSMAMGSLNMPMGSLGMAMGSLSMPLGSLGMSMGIVGVPGSLGPLPRPGQKLPSLPRGMDIEDYAAVRRYGCGAHICFSLGYPRLEWCPAGMGFSLRFCRPTPHKHPCL